MKIIKAKAATHAIALFAFFLLSVVMTWPLLLDMKGSVISSKYYWDAFTNTAIMGAHIQNLLRVGVGGLYDNYFFAPIPNSIVFNENLFGLSLFYAPVYLLTNESILAYNCVLILSLTFSGYFTFVLVKKLTGSSLAGVLSGIGFAFCPYVFFEIGRIQLVATQWIPLCLLFVHRAAEEGNKKDIAGLVISYVLQVGTCLYYALFLLPILGFMWFWLVIGRRHGLVFWKRVVVIGFCGAATIAAMIYPYLKERERFDLTRTEDYAAAHDGKTSFFLNVDTGNRFLNFLHHTSEGGGVGRGAREEIAFLGFTLILLAIIGALWPLIRADENGEGKKGGIAAQFLVLITIVFFGAVGATTVFKTSLIAIPIVIIAWFYWKTKLSAKAIYTDNQAMYLWLLIVTVILFLGMELYTVNGEAVKGIYYYFYKYIPGYDGIRKVSRQAIVVMMIVSILAGFGAKELFATIKKPTIRKVLFAFFAVTIIIEFANVPVGLAKVRSSKEAHDVYKWLRGKNRNGTIAVIPFDDGIEELRGHPAMALHNFYALYHEHRTLNGRSSWFPPVTELFRKEIGVFPKGNGTRLLKLLGVKYLVVHRAEIEETKAQDIVKYLENATDSYKKVYHKGTDLTYEIIPDKSNLIKADDAFTRSAVEIHRWQVNVASNDNQNAAHLAFDGDNKTRWCVRRADENKKWIEYKINRLESITAIDFTNFTFVLDAPFTYEVWISKVDASSNEDALASQENENEFKDWELVVARKEMQLYEDQVFNPKTFVFRIKMPKPTQARRVRIRVLDTEPVYWWCINETRIWVKK